MLSQECFAEVLLACALIVKQLPCPFPGSCKVARKLCSSLLCQRWSRILVAENALMNPLTHHRTGLSPHRHLMFLLLWSFVFCLHHHPLLSPHPHQL